MDRRGFLKGLGFFGAALATAEIPLGRVYSFPTEIKVANAVEISQCKYYNPGMQAYVAMFYNKRFMENLKNQVVFTNISKLKALPESSGSIFMYQALPA